MESLLILGAGPMQVPAIETAQAMGVRVVAIDPDPNAAGLAIADHRYVFDLADIGNCLETAWTHQVNGVMTLAAEYPMPTVARIARELDLPGIDPETVQAATDKHRMRRRFAAAGVPSTASWQAFTLDQAIAAYARIDGPAIVKPTVSHGGRGISYIAARAGTGVLETAFNRALAATRAEGVLVEEFIDGPEFSVEALTYEGHTRVVAVTDKVTSGPPYFVELGHSQPTMWPQEDVAKLTAVALRGIEALGIDWGPSHTEIRLSPDGPRLVEIGARLGGGYITSHLVPGASGVNLVRNAILLALGKQPDLRPRHAAGAAIRFITAPPGRISEITGMAEARAVPGVAELSLYRKPTDDVMPLQDGTGRIGHVISVAEDAATAVKSAEQARDMVMIRTHKGALTAFA